MRTSLQISPGTTEIERVECSSINRRFGGVYGSQFLVKSGGAGDDTVGIRVSRRGSSKSRVMGLVDIGCLDPESKKKTAGG